MAEGKAEVIKGLGNEPKVIQLTGWIGLEGVCMVVRPWCLWGFVVALISRLLSHYRHQFPTLWFPPPDTLGSRTLLSDSQPHCHRLMVLGEYFLLPVIHVCYQQERPWPGWCRRGTRTLFPLILSSRCPFGSFPNLWSQF